MTDELKQLLTDAGMRYQAELSREIGVRQEAISRWETVPQYAKAYLLERGRRVRAEKALEALIRGKDDNDCL